MRYPEFLKKGGTIGFIAPSFGCAIEPYKTRFDNAGNEFKKRGYNLWFGPNCYEGSGIGISNTPEKCAEELNLVMTDRIDTPDKPDVIITCGGGELMCEVVPYIDFEKIAESTPKWYMGYSDNTNYTFLSTVLADTAAIYGPCAPAFGRVPWHSSLDDAMSLLTGENLSVSGYDLWEKSEAEEGTALEGLSETDRYLLPYNVTEKRNLVYFIHGRGPLSGDSIDEEINLSGRMIGGCVDILTLLVGTKYDKVDQFLEKYKEDGFIWFLECCDLDMLSIRRAFWHMREAGWFKYVKGFLIGRPLHFGEDAFGVDQYTAVTSVIGEMGAPVIMDLDIGHLPPMMPIISGSTADISLKGNSVNIRYKLG